MEIDERHNADLAALRRGFEQGERRGFEQGERRGFEQGERGGPALAEGISVVVPSYRGRDHVGRCLRSLAAQTLDPADFEVLLVLNGEADGTDSVVAEVRAAHPTFPLRVVRLPRAGAARARNAGLAAARREYTTFVDDDDHVSPRYLEGLLAYAADRIVPVASLVDVGPDGENPDNDINRALAARAGRPTTAWEMRQTTTFNAGKAISTRLAREIGYDGELASGEDVVFWATVAARGHVQFRPCPPEAGACYYRVMRPDSVSRAAVSYDFAVAQRVEVIARLDRVAAEADPWIRGLVEGRMRAQANFIADYLAQRPGEHGRVVADLDGRGIGRFPYARMNRELDRGLAIAYAFPPYADTSAVVSAKRVRARGEVVDVVSNAMDSIRTTDESLRRIAGPFVAREAAVRTPSYFSDWSAMEAFAVHGLRVVRGWQRRGRYRFVYSRAHFAASHLLAAAYKLGHPDVPWTAEFSDPLSRDIADAERGTSVRAGALLTQLRVGLRRRGLAPPPSTNCMVWCEELAYALADELLFTNVNQMEHMLGYCTRPELAELARSKARIAPHPTLPAPFYRMADAAYDLEPGIAHLAYFGTFYASRGLDDVLAALAASDARTRERVRLHVFTTNADDVRARAAEFGVADRVRTRPYVRYLEFLNLTTRMDVLIVNDAVTGGRHPRNPYLPSKWSDYRGAGALVWGLVEAGSALSAEPLDLTSPAGDRDAAREVLASIVRKRLG